MQEINRREFIARTAGVAAVTWSAPRVGQAQPPPLTGATLRPLGKTGLHCTLLGVGTGMKAWGGHSELTRKGHDAFMGVLQRAYEQGIRYLDMADMYGSHPYVKEALAKFINRDHVTLLTKTSSREPERVRADVERFRKELDTDRLDIVLLHCVNDPDWPNKLNGCMDALEDFKAKGVLRAHGLSSHNLEAARRAAETEWVDVLLERINPFGIHMDADPDQVAPVLKKAHENGKGVLGMKIGGEGQCRDKIAESLKFVLGLGCVDAMPIGFLDPGEIDSAFDHVTQAAVASA
jgi:aryl-alcohol dehydrogenase-like predicted oxidoreductase